MRVAKIISIVAEMLHFIHPKKKKKSKSIKK